ncbi:DMT family transporter [Flavobacteriales bacterium]|nr:DMT family transporter [Flavobacteriales bacterium]
MDKSLKNYLTLLFLAIIWGSSFILMKRGLEVFNFMQVASLRIVIAFLSLIPFLPKAFRNVKKKHLLPIIIMAILGNGLPAFLFTKAQTHLDSSFVGILNAIVPLFTLILGVYFFKSKTTKANIIGIVLGLFGAVLLTVNSLSDGVEMNFYVCLVVLATVFYAISINVIKKYLSDLNASSITALAFLIIGPLSSVYLFSTDFTAVLVSNENGMMALVYIALLSVLGTSMAVIIFNKLISRSSAIFASSVTYLIPIVAILWGFFDGEIITPYHLFGMLIILSGVYLVNKKSPTN